MKKQENIFAFIDSQNDNNKLLVVLSPHRKTCSSLSVAKKFGPQYKNDIPKLLELCGKDQAVAKPYSWFTKVGDITENDYILSANTYSPYNGEEEVNHREPKEILKEIESEEKKLESALGEVKKLL